MRKLLQLSFLALIFAVGFSQASYANCDFVGPNGGGNILNCSSPLQGVPLDASSTPPNNTTTDNDIVTVEPEGGVELNVGSFAAIDTDQGSDTVTIAGRALNEFGLAGVSTTFFGFGGNDNDTVTINPGADILGATGLITGRAADMVTMNGGSVVGNFTAGIFTGGGPDTVVINDGEVGGGFIVSLSTDTGSDMLTVNGGNFNGPIEMFFGDDLAILNGGVFNFFTIDMSFGSDTIHITNNLTDIGILFCGPQTDTLIMSMQVPANEVAQLTQDFLAQGDDGILEVNGITYQWFDCENLVPNFNGVVTTILLSPIGATNPVGTDHTVDAEVFTNIGGANQDLLVTFEVTSGPNAGLNSNSDGFCSPNPDCTTDSNGDVSWTYTSDGLIGTDTIVATIDDQFIGMTSSNTVEKLWVNVPLEIPTLGEWGLIAMAGLLGIVGFMVVRRRQLSA